MASTPASDTSAAGASRATVRVWQSGVAQQGADWLAVETPVALVFNGISHAVMLSSPIDLEDLALGFALTEGIVSNAREVYGIEVHPACDDGIEVHIDIASECFMRLKERRRNLAGRTGCGLCGVDSLSAVQRALPAHGADAVPPARNKPTSPTRMQAVAKAHRLMQQGQTLQALCGGLHAAAWCSWTGEVLLLREDVGRHNALDKVIGALSKTHTNMTEGFMAVSSRASFEMAQKTALAGASLLAAVSAPTQLAVKTAQSCGLTLVGFVRGERAVVYSEPAH